MGYTHYWSFKDDNLEEKKFKKIVADIKVIEDFFKRNDFYSENAGGYYAEGKEDSEPVKLFDYGGLNKGVLYKGWVQNDKLIDVTALGFNGDGSKNLDHETFSINVGENEWNFCKTARKPYDLAVCLALLSIKYHTRSTSVSSDGNNEDWEHAFEMFEYLFPKRKVYFRFKEWVADSKKFDGSLSVISAKKATKDLLEKGVAV